MSTSHPNLPPHPNSENAEPPSSKPNRQWLGLGLGLAGVAVVSAIAGALLAVGIASTPLLQRQLSQQEAEVFNQDEPISTNLDFRLPQLTRPVNILVMGIKVLASDVAEPPAELRNLSYDALVNSLDGLSDTILLLRFSPETQKVVVLSIPRDTQIELEGIGLTKLNATNTYGGPALAATTISDLLGGVAIDRYVRINVQGVEKLIDALGGVSIYVPYDMKYQDDSQHLYINLSQGQQHLNGNKALQFLRFRYDEKGDIGRVQRQQMLMRALMEQTLHPATLSRLSQILSVIQDHVDTNLSVEELMALSGFAAQMQRSHVEMLMLPGEFGAVDAYDSGYWLPHPDQAQDIVAKHFNHGWVTTATNKDMESDLQSNPVQFLTVAIQDTTNKTEGTQKMLQALNQAGYENAYIDLPWTEPLRKTRIIAQRGDVQSAELIRQVLRVGEVRIESTGNLESDITIQIGQDWLQSQGFPIRNVQSR